MGVLGDVVVAVGQIREDIDDLVVANLFVEVREDEKFARGETCADAVELRFDLGAVLAVAHLENGLDKI